MTAPFRLKRLGRRARLTVGAAALGGLIAVLATARGARVEPQVARPAPLAIAEHEPKPVTDPTWTLGGADPVARIGYRNGRPHVFDVVPLGPAGIEVEVRTASAFLAMRAAAAEAKVDLGLESGFRTVEQQRALFRAWRNGRGNKAARPGRSNHQSGRALDIGGISAPGALAWLEANAASFGFKRTVKSEPWHWEYVAVPIARGAPKRASQKPAKAVAAKRPTRRPANRPPRHPSSVATTHGSSSGGRVASLR